MKWIILVSYLIITFVLAVKGFISIDSLYIGLAIMLSAEYIEDCIERNK